jgi:hypothetical protein
MFWTGRAARAARHLGTAPVQDAPEAAASAANRAPRRARSRRSSSRARPTHRGLLRTTIFAGLLSTGVQGGYYTLATWVPTYLKTERGLSVVGTGGYLTFLISGAFLGYLTGGYLTDVLGRKRNIWLFALLSAICILAYTNIPSGANTLLLVLGFPLGFCMSAIFSGFGSYLSELYPTAVRGTGQGFTYNTGRAVGAVFPTLVGFLADSWGVGGALVFGAIGYGHRGTGAPRTAGDPWEGTSVSEPTTEDRPLTLVDEHAHAWSPAFRPGPLPGGSHGPHGRGRGGPHPGQPDLGARRLGVRHAAVLPAQPEALPGARRHGRRLLDDRPRRRRGPAHRSAALPGVAGRRVGRTSRRTCAPTGATTWCRSSSAAASPSSGRCPRRVSRSATSSRAATSRCT